jgi:hypothetical protein
MKLPESQTGCGLVLLRLSTCLPNHHSPEAAALARAAWDGLRDEGPVTRPKTADLAPQGLVLLQEQEAHSSLSI